MFTAALFTVAKIWKPPRCLSIDKWIKKVWGPRVCVYIYLYIYIYISISISMHINIQNRISRSNKKQNLAMWQHMDESRGYYTKGNKWSRERQTPYNFTDTWNLKTKWDKQNKQKQTHRNREQRDGCEKEGDGAIDETGKGNIINNIVISLHGDRWLLELVGWSHRKLQKCQFTVLYTWNYIINIRFCTNYTYIKKLIKGKKKKKRFSKIRQE